MMAGTPSGNSQDFELNLASIIDCFTVLITFLLVSASFLSIGILDAGIAAGGVEAKPGAVPPAVTLTVELKEDFTFVVKLAGKETRANSIAGTSIGTSGKSWDMVKLDEELKGIKGKWPTLGAATLVAESNVEYKEVVRSMEAIRKVMPAVLLGGF